jgi:diguanylate cyclase (GGDEF)-like protein
MDAGGRGRPLANPTGQGSILRGLAFRVALLVFATTLATSIAIAWISVRSVQARLEQQVDASLPGSLRAVGEQIEHWYRTVELDVRVRATSDALARGATRAETQGFLERSLARAAYAAAAVIDEGGGVVASAGERFAVAREELAAMRHASGAHIGALQRSGTRRFQLVSAPIQGRSGHRLVFALPAEALDEQLQHSGGDAHVGVVDPTGGIVAGSLPVLPLYSSRDDFVTIADGSGREFRVASEPIERFGWRLIVVEDRSEMRDTVNGIVRETLASNLIVAFAASALAFALGAWRMRPIQALADGARRLAAGETSVRVPERGVLGELRSLASAFNEMAERLDESRRALQQRHQELLQANEVLEQLSITDGLTKLHNHRHFQEQFAREARRAERTPSPFCLVLVDIDNFKRLNDDLGHSAGDRVLEAVAVGLNAATRETDYVARYGGEEFALLLPDTEIEGGVALAEKLRMCISALELPVIGPEGRVRVTASFGVAQYRRSTSETFDAADRALYEAKAGGKDCVVAAPAPPR